MERIYPDANVLYPISLADLTLRLADAWVHEILWSVDLLAEVERVLVEHKGLSREQSRHFCACVRESFPHGEIPRSAYEDLIASRTGRDPDDHVHSAAAVGGGATILLTANLRDFPARDLDRVRKVKPDDYYLEVLAAFPDDVLAVIDDMGSQRREAQAPAETLDALRRAGLPRFAAQVSSLLGPDNSR